MKEREPENPQVQNLSDLDRASRMRLMKFVCSFAWADLEVRAAERTFVANLASKLDLDEDASIQVKAWLDVPPVAEAVDPGEIPAPHRKLFLEEIEGVILSDGEIATEEQENFVLLRELLV